MKRYVSLGIVLLMFAIAGVAESASDKGSKGSSGTEQALKDLENRWVNALVKSDVATFDSILSDGYVRPMSPEASTTNSPMLQRSNRVT